MRLFLGFVFGALTVMPLSRTEIDAITSQMKLTRARHEPTWREIARHMAPNTYRHELSDTDRGDRMDDEIADSLVFEARATLEAGFLSHVTSPARPWVKLKIADDPELAEFGPVAEFLDRLSGLSLMTFQDAGVYEALQPFYGTKGLYSNAMLWHEERFKTVLHAKNLAMGSWWVGNGPYGDAAFLYREFRLTVYQTVKQFGLENTSVAVRNAWDGSRYQEAVDVAHFIYPNPDYNPGDRRSIERPFKSLYYELGTPGRGKELRDTERGGLYLSVGGFNHFPALHGMWDQIGDDTYGYHGPGRTCLPDVMELYHGEHAIMDAMDVKVRPPTMAHSSLKAQLRNSLGFMAGQHVWVDDMEKMGVRSIYERVDFQLDHASARQQLKREQIARAWHNDTFRMLDFLEERQRTATEIQARQEERLVRLAGVLNRLNRRVLDPLVENTVMWLIAQGRVGEIPDELRGRQISVEYISTAAHAMRSIGLSSIDRVLGAASAMVEFYPEVRDKLDLDQVIDEVAQRSGAPARIIRSDEDARTIRDARARAMAEQAEREQLLAATQGVKNLAGAKTGEKNVLTDLASAAAEGQG